MLVGESLCVALSNDRLELVEQVLINLAEAEGDPFRYRHTCFNFNRDWSLPFTIRRNSHSLLPLGGREEAHCAYCFCETGERVS